MSGAVPIFARVNDPGLARTSVSGEHARLGRWFRRLAGTFFFGCSRKRGAFAHARDGRAPRSQIILPRPEPRIIFGWFRDASFPGVPANVTKLLGQIRFRTNISVEDFFFPKRPSCFLQPINLMRS